MVWWPGTGRGRRRWPGAGRQGGTVVDLDVGDLAGTVGATGAGGEGVADLEGPARACGGGGVPGVGDVGLVDVQAHPPERATYQPPPTASRPAPETSPTLRASPRPSTTPSASACRTSQATSTPWLSALPKGCAAAGLRLVGIAPGKASIVSLVLDGHEPTEAGTVLNQEGIAVRAGHYCPQPILRRYGLKATVRPPFAFYNTHEEVDALVTAVHRLADRRPRQ